MSLHPDPKRVNRWFFVFCILFLAYQIPLGLILGEALRSMAPVLTLINLFLLTGFVVLYGVTGRIPLKALIPVGRPRLLPLLLVAAAAVPALYVASAANVLVAYPLQLIGFRYSLPLEAPENVSELLRSWLFFALLPGFSEELLFRGALQRSFAPLGRKMSVVLAALLFGAFHFNPGNFTGPVVLGLLFGLYALRTGSILPAILGHLLNNALAMLYLFLGDPLNRDGSILVTPQEFLLTLGTGLAGALLLAVILPLFLKVTAGMVPERSEEACERALPLRRAGLVPLIGVALLFAVLAGFQLAA